MRLLALVLIVVVTALISGGTGRRSFRAAGRDTGTFATAASTTSR